MTSKKLLPAVFALAAIMLGSGFGAAQAAPQSIQTFETTEQINLEEISNILETQTIVEIESQDKLTFVALEQQVLVLNEEHELVAIVGEELKEIADRDDVKVVPAELEQIRELATNEDSRLVIVQDTVLTVVDTERIMTEQVPQIVELEVVDESVFWKQEAKQLQTATITEDRVIALDVDRNAHVFESLSTQEVQYQQIPTTISLEKEIAQAVSIDELNGVVAIVDEEQQLMLIQERDLIQNIVEDVILVPIATEAIQVELVAVDTEVAKIIVVENEIVEKIVVDMISETLVEIETIEMALTTLVEDDRVLEITSPIAITLDQEDNLLVLLADNRIAAFDDLAIELNQPTNEIISTVQIVRADDKLATLSSCSVNIVEGAANYGQVTIGEIAETQFVLQTEGSPIVSVMGTEWLTAEGEIVMDSDVTHYKLVTAEQGEEPLLQTVYDDMERLTTEPVSFGQVEDVQELELFLQLQVPTTYDRESLDATQTVAVFAEC